MAAQEPRFHRPHTSLIPSGTGGIQQTGKIRRPIGDPVAPPKEPLRFEGPPPPTVRNFTLPLEVVAPEAAARAAASGRLVFHTVGDTGGIHGDATQVAIAEAMEQQLKDAEGPDTPAFLYLLGDVVYFNGLSTLYKWQFYEPYQYYPAPIFAIAGNHDGDTHVRHGDPPDPEPTLTGFMRNFCDTTPRPALYRTTMIQPYVHWTLATPVVTIIGLYSNVEGCLDPRGRRDQEAWLTTQLEAAPTDKKLLVAVHHPCYSLDKPHGGCPDVLVSLDNAMLAADRRPDAVLSGHVHNYQRFSRDVGGTSMPYIVAGAGGYANTPRAMHRLQAIPDDRPYQTTLEDVQLEKDNEDDPGYLRVTVTEEDVTFEYFVVPFDGSPPPAIPFDSVTV
jgi:Calcineurin-like phosphoesterase